MRFRSRFPGALCALFLLRKRARNNSLLASSALLKYMKTTSFPTAPGFVFESNDSVRFDILGPEHTPIHLFLGVPVPVQRSSFLAVPTPHCIWRTDSTMGPVDQPFGRCATRIVFHGVRPQRLVVFEALVEGTACCAARRREGSSCRLAAGRGRGTPSFWTLGPERSRPLIVAAVLTHSGAFFLYRPRRLGEGREVESPEPKRYPHRSP